MSYLSSPEEEVKEFSSRYRMLYIAISVMAALFMIRLWYLQVFKGSELRLWSEKNRIKIQKVQAPRGMILDREGRVLVDNRPGFDVVITPQYAMKLQETAEVLSPVIQVPADEIIRNVQKGRRYEGAFKPVVLKENLSRDEVARVERLRLHHPGLKIEMRIKRTYLIGDNGAQFFGYVGEITENQLKKLNAKRETENRLSQGDIIGRSGIELHYDDILRGRDGISNVQVDAFGREASIEAPQVLSSLGRSQESDPGHTMILTLDKDVQEATYDAFINTERIGAAVAIENKTGKILSWVSSPTFDPALFWPKIENDEWEKLINDPFKPLRNKVIQDHHAPGSTFKAIVAIAGLEEKVINRNSTQFCPGYIRFGRRLYHCHSRGGHGNVNIVQAIERSCNVFFYKLGISLGIDKIAKYARSLGIGKRTGVDLANEVPGLMPTEAWKKRELGEEWQPGENLSNAIGQGFVLTTPIQLASVFSGIANEGPRYKPYFIDKIINIDGQVIREFEPELISNTMSGEKSEVKISQETFDLVKKGLWAVNNGDAGTARWYKIPGVELSGKSGTTQIVNLTPDQVFVKCKSRPIEQRHHGWFVGYAPYEDPKITVAVLAEHSCSGSGGGAPVVRDIIRSYIEKYHPELMEKKRVAMKVVPVREPVRNVEMSEVSDE